MTETNALKREIAWHQSASLFCIVGYAVFVVLRVYATQQSKTLAGLAGGGG